MGPLGYGSMAGGNTDVDLINYGDHTVGFFGELNEISYLKEESLPSDHYYSLHRSCYAPRVFFDKWRASLFRLQCISRFGSTRNLTNPKFGTPNVMLLNHGLKIYILSLSHCNTPFEA